MNAAFKWEIWTPEQQAEYESRPETIEWEAYCKRAESNARLHCIGCGRFVKGSSSRTVHHYNGMFDCIRIEYNCSKCGPMKIECV